MPGSVCVGAASSSVAVGAAAVDEADFDERVGGVDIGDFDGEADFVDGGALGVDFDGDGSLVDDEPGSATELADDDVRGDEVGGVAALSAGDARSVGDVGGFKPAGGSRAMSRIPRATSTACCISSRSSQPPSVARHSTSASDATRAITPSHALRSAWPRPCTLRTPVKPSAAASSSGLRRASTRRLRSVSTSQP
jgi:hypothetical protein